MEKTPKSDNGYVLAAILVAAIGCTTLTPAAYAQQSLDGEIAGSTNDADKQPYTREDLPVPEPQSLRPQSPQPLSVGQPSHSPAEYTLSPEAEAETQAVVDIIDSYKRCVRGIIASDSPTTVKREEIDSECWAERQQIADTLPQEIQEFMLLNMDRRIDLVLRTMAEAEDVVDNTMQDIFEAVSELSAETGQEDRQ